ncbi:MAG: phosphoglycerate dehydrogenase [Chloroflexi bacterium]|nr:phosphoglycerate dehydrogenase [Chloroflexota bacterium]
MAILVVDPIAEDGIDVLRSHAEVEVRLGLSPNELLQLVPKYQALVVRSETRVTADVIAAGKNLQVIGRAGVGVDNIDVDAATERGIVVVNAPAAITITTAEHTFALIMAAARNIPQAAQSLREGRWDRSKFVGSEIRGKTLGVYGMGRIGSAVAKRALAFEMDVIGFDPYLPEDAFQRLGVELVDLESLLARADFLTLHVPATADTENLIGSVEFAKMKPTAWLINCARGALVDEAALIDALDRGVIAGAALDVFKVEPAADNPLVRHPKVVSTPHLAASTREAQASVGVETAEQIIAVLEGRPAPFAVNAPIVSGETARVLGPYAHLTQILGNLCTQLAEGRMRSVQLTYSGDIADYDTTVLRASAIRGLLERVSGENVNLVNASIVARNRGLRITERTTSTAQPYANLVLIHVETDRGTSSVGGTVINGEPHIVCIDDYWVTVVPTDSHLLLIRHTDQPGMIGKVGTILGEADINISSMQVGRERPRGRALMLLSLDDPVPPAVVRRISDVTNLNDVKSVRI